MSQLDYRKLGFTLTLPETADALECPQTEVRDLLLMGDLAAVVVRAGIFEPATWLFHPDEVRAFARIRAARARSVDSNNRSRVLALLRDYLDRRPADDDYDRAMLNGSAILTNTREGVAVNVVVDTVLLFNEHNGFPHGPITASMMEEALRHAGAVRVRGFTAASAPGVQRWGWSWRLPDALSPQADDTTVARQLATGVLDPGEKVARQTDGSATLS